jgi:hypothetical protein
MANFVFNIAKGRVAEFYNRVQTNDPAGSQLVVLAINTSSADGVLEDLASINALLTDGNTSEPTNSGYVRVDLDGTDLSALAVDNTNDYMPCDIDDITWTAVAATGGAWTDLVIAYDPTGSAADDALIPLTCHDFAVTPDGSDITAQVADFYRAS